MRVHERQHHHPDPARCGHRIWVSGHTAGRTRRAKQALECAEQRECILEPTIDLRVSLIISYCLFSFACFFRTASSVASNFNNARILVKKLEQRGVAGACIEDKLFPKTNSLLGNSEGKPLASIEEFSSKIRAMKDTQKDPDFVVVARIEAFISGWGLDEALKRAEAYKAAGADAVLIHSKKSDDAEIASFCKAWNGKHPVIIVPTKYYTTPTQVTLNAAQRSETHIHTVARSRSLWLVCSCLMPPSVCSLAFSRNFYFSFLTDLQRLEVQWSHLGQRPNTPHTPHKHTRTHPHKHIRERASSRVARPRPSPSVLSLTSRLLLFVILSGSLCVPRSTISALA